MPELCTMKYKEFKKELASGQCRKCINKKFNVHLEHQDCEYWEYPEKCTSCGKVKNIVTGIAFTKRYKIWFMKTK